MQNRDNKALQPKAYRVKQKQEVLWTLRKRTHTIGFLKTNFIKTNFFVA
jgi:hypothetical protein